MKSVHGAALRRNTFSNNSTASIEVVTSSPNLFGPEPTTTCQRCGKSFEPRQHSGGKVQLYCSTDCRKGKVPNAEPTPNPTPTSPEVVGNIVGKVVGEDVGNPDDTFEWSAEDVCIPTQAMTAVYLNPRGDLVIRQENIDCYQAEEPVILISKENIPQFLDRLAVLCEDCDDGVLSGRR